MDLRFYSPLLVSVVVWGQEASSFRHASWVYIPRVLNFHFSMSFLFYMEIPHWCFMACFDDWVDTLRSDCPNVGVGRCWVSCTYTVEAVRVVGVWVGFRTDGGLGLLTSFRDIWCPWVVGVGRETSLFCILAVEALHGEGEGGVDGRWMGLCGLGTLNFLRYSRLRWWRWARFGTLLFASLSFVEYLDN
jgi:hypothetical protein